MPRLRRPSAPRRGDIRAGVVLGVESVPDGLASGVLAGVNPAYGLYGYMVGVGAGALSTSSTFMAVQATGAMSVVIADVPAVQDGPNAATALFTLSFVTGAIMLTLGLLRLGTLVRFVPHSVLIGFINAVAINIVLGQLANLTGYAAPGDNRVTRAVNTLVRPDLWDVPTLLVGLGTIALIVLLERTPLKSLGLVVAVVVASGVVAWWGLDSVRTLSDLADIPSSLPRPQLPDPRLVAELLVPAASLALVGLVQGAAISGSFPNPDGRLPDASGDFRGQGVANLACGVLQGMPVGGSMSATTIVTSSGARTRWANLIAAVVVALMIVVFGDALGGFALTSIAGLLILIGIRSLRIPELLAIWRTGRVQAATAGVTFVLTLLIPLQYAVLVGVAISVVLYVVRESNRVRLVRWVLDDDGIREEDVPAELAGNDIVVLQPYGSLFFAAAPTLAEQFPRPTPASGGAVVILRLRGEQEVGSTFVTVLDRYREELQAVGARLMLAGVGEEVQRQLVATGLEQRLDGAVFPARTTLTRSVRQAVELARDWQGRSLPD